MTLEGKMERFAVNSSNLASIGYDEEQSTLEVEFNSGYVYLYYGVSQHHFAALMSSRSVGKYFDRTIRKGRFRYRQVS